MKRSEPHIYIKKTSNSSYDDTQMLGEHASISTSKIFNYQSDINKFQLPVPTQHSSISNTIQSNSFPTHLNEQNGTVSSKESISSDNLTSDVHKHSSIDSKDRNLVATPFQNTDDRKSSSGKIVNTVNNVIHTPIMLAPNHSIAQKPANSILSPSRTIVNIICTFKLHSLRFIT